MSERWPKFGSKQPTVLSVAGGPASVKDAPPEDPVGLPGAAVDPAATLSEPTEMSMAAAQVDSSASGTPIAGDATARTAEAATGAEAATTDEGAPEATEAAPADAPAAAAEDEGAVFLAELVRAMQTTASLERTRIREDTDRRRDAHIEEVRAREAAEADRMRELAGDDLKSIDAWAAGETKRIQLERERREKELNADLETSLAGHRAKIDREIEGVEAAIASYRAEVDLFFERLDRETDPVLIAQHAGRRPVFPTLAAVEETPGGGAPMVGVMDAEALAAQALAARIGAWPGSPFTNAEPASAGSPTDVVGGEASGPAESMIAEAPPGSGNGDSLLGTVPAVRPMSWLRRGGIGGDDSSNRPE
jgi:hypothetical protein